MAFCTNCGTALVEGAKFCGNCGAAVNFDTNKTRKTVFEGEIHKCPRCGEELPSFAATCPLCGYEIRGAQAPNSVREFALLLSQTENETKKVNLIRNFPIPNAKEDILEFMILATTNFSAEDHILGCTIRKDTADAWFAKIEQGYKKAKILFENDSDFAKVEKSYNQISSRIATVKQNMKKRVLSQVAISTIGLWGGLALLILAFLGEVAFDANTSLFHLLGGAIMVGNALFIGRDPINKLDIAVGVVCGVLALLFGKFLQNFFDGNGSIMNLAGIATITLSILGPIKFSLFRPTSTEGIPLIRVPTAVLFGTSENYVVIESLLIHAGFTIVQSVPLQDLSMGVFKKSGTVASITVNGKELSSYFFRKFPANTPIVVSYHSFR